jgi:hypothetical protein
MPLSFASGTPQTVRELIEELLDQPSVDRRVRAAVERLAADDSMIGFWHKVPTGKEAAIAEAAALSFERAIGLPKTKAQARFAELVPNPFFASIPIHARALREALTNNAQLMRACWDMRSDNQAITFEQLLAVIDDLAVFAERLESETQDIRKMWDLPKPQGKLGSATASRVYFSRAMKHLLRQICGQPHIEVVAALEQVMFDLPDAVDESTVRKR